MKKRLYVWPDDYLDGEPDRPSMTVVEQDSVDTGLLDKDGNKLTRPKLPIGFVRHGK